MKTRLLFFAALLSLAACQKELSNKKSTALQSNETTATTDSVHLMGYASGISDNHIASGIFNDDFTDDFTTPADTGYYVKEATFVARHTKGVNISKFKLFVDTARRIQPVTTLRNKDTVKITFGNAYHLVPNHSGEFSKTHNLNLWVEATGVKDAFVQFKLIDLVIIRKYPKPAEKVPVSGLPETSWKSIFL